MDEREDPGHGVRSQGLRGEPACSGQWLCHLEQSAQSVVQGADGRHTRRGVHRGDGMVYGGYGMWPDPRELRRQGAAGLEKGRGQEEGLPGPNSGCAPQRAQLLLGVCSVARPMGCAWQIRSGPWVS